MNLYPMTFGLAKKHEDSAGHARLHQQTNDIVILPVQLEHTLALDKLPPVRKDPFDRLLIAQAMVENAVLISADPIFSKYAARVVW